MRYLYREYEIRFLSSFLRKDSFCLLRGDAILRGEWGAVLFLIGWRGLWVSIVYHLNVADSRLFHLCVGLRFLSKVQSYNEQKRILCVAANNNRLLCKTKYFIEEDYTNKYWEVASFHIVKFFPRDSLISRLI